MVLAGSDTSLQSSERSNSALSAKYKQLTAELQRTRTNQIHIRWKKHVVYCWKVKRITNKVLLDADKSGDDTYSMSGGAFSLASVSGLLFRGDSHIVCAAVELTSSGIQVKVHPPAGSPRATATTIALYWIKRTIGTSVVALQNV